MNICAAAITVSLIACAAMGGEVLHLSRDDRRHLLEDRFKIVGKVADLPVDVVAAFSEHTRQSPFLMANPGEPWQATDSVMNSNLPARRLVFAGVSDGYCVVHFETGGIAHCWWVALFQRSSRGPAKLAWSAMAEGWGGFASLDDLRTALKKEKLRDDMRYGW